METGEETLVLRAKQGDQLAFEQLVIDNQARIYTLAVRMSGNQEDGADLAQETFLLAWEKLSTFHGQSSFATWLYRLSSNLCIDFLRKQHRRREIAPVSSLDDEDSYLPQPTNNSQDPQTRLEERELRALISTQLQALSEHHRQILLMREFAGLSYQEIARALDIDEGTVKSRLARARTALKNKIMNNRNFSDMEPSILPKTNTRG